MPKYIDIDSAYDYGTLYDWYISSVSDTDAPVWTDEHIEELLNDFYLIPKDTPTANVVLKSAYDQVLWERDVAESQLTKLGLSLGENPDRKVKPIKHGHWIKEYLGYGIYRYKCSVCGSLFGKDMIDDFNHNQYCSDCGAKMDGINRG